MLNDGLSEMDRCILTNAVNGSGIIKNATMH